MATAEKTGTAAGGSKSSAARGEKKNEAPKGHTVSFRGEKFRFPAKPPFSVLKHFHGKSVGGEPAALVGMVTELLGEEQMDKFYAFDLDMEEGMDALVELLKKGMKPYGISLGGSSASQDS